MPVDIELAGSQGLAYVQVAQAVELVAVGGVHSMQRGVPAAATTNPKILPAQPRARQKKLLHCLSGSTLKM